VRGARGGPPLTEVWSHRGRVAPGDAAAENTVAAFAAASAAKVDGIELDVWLTLDGVWVVHHDQRCGAGELDHLRRADVPRSIPDLCEALAACSVETVNVELKVPPTADRSEARRLGGELGQYMSLPGILAATVSRLVVSSFSREAAGAVLATGATTGLLLEATPTGPELVSLAREGYWAAHLEHSHLGARDVTAIHEAGLRAVAWTVDGENDIARLARQGVDVLISNFAEHAAAFTRGLR